MNTPPLSHPSVTLWSSLGYPWHVIQIEIRGGQGVASAGKESTWNQTEAFLLVVLLSNGCIIYIQHHNVVQMNISISAPCRPSNTPFLGPEVVPERWKVAYLVSSLPYEVKAALIEKSSQFAIFHVPIVMQWDQRFGSGGQLCSTLHVILNIL